jgi:hypothetical protein
VSVKCNLRHFLTGLYELLRGFAPHLGDDSMRCWHVLCTKFFHGVLFLSLLFPCDLLYSRKAYAMVFFHPQSVVSNPRWIVLRNTPISISNLYFEEAMSLSFCSVGTQRLMGIMENQMASILSRLC